MLKCYSTSDFYKKKGGLNVKLKFLFMLHIDIKPLFLNNFLIHLLNP